MLALSGVESRADESAHANEHGPIGVMGDHTHEKGEVMFSYRFMHMGMEGNRSGTNSLSPETIATTTSNRFFGAPMQPPTLRVVPTKMTMDMHMVGVMYAPLDTVTFMFMGSYVTKEMSHVTFAGPGGTTRLGTFKTKSDGFGDTKVTALIRLLKTEEENVHVSAGVSLPSGSTKKTDRVLAPTGATPTLRLPYPMQLGSGTVDFLPGLTYTGADGKIGWGAQYAGVIRTGRNNGYSLGDQHQASFWFSYLWHPSFSTSFRVRGQTIGAIDGIDPAIVAPVQTADPANQGGEMIDVSVGANYLVQSGALKGHRFGVEATLPIYRDLNGPQLETDWSITAGWQYLFM
jgi:hypothetical protein